MIEMPNRKKMTATGMMTIIVELSSIVEWAPGMYLVVDLLLAFLEEVMVVVVEMFFHGETVSVVDETFSVMLAKLFLLSAAIPLTINDTIKTNLKINSLFEL